MKLPSDVDGSGLTVALRKLGYEQVRQRGSHVRLTTKTGGEHHEVIPMHNPIKTKTLSSILKSIAHHHRTITTSVFSSFCENLIYDETTKISGDAPDIPFDRTLLQGGHRIVRSTP